MTTLSFKSADLNLTESVTTTVDSVGKNWVVFESHPDTKITIDPKQLRDLTLKIGDMVKLEAVTNTFTLTTLDAAATEPKTSPRPVSGASFGQRLTNDLD